MIEAWGQYTQPAQVWTAIPGFFDYEEVYARSPIGLRMGIDGRDRNCFLGRSACWLGEQLHGSRQERDPALRGRMAHYIRTQPGTTTELEAPFETFLANVRQSGLLDIIVPIRVQVGPSCRRSSRMA